MNNTKKTALLILDGWGISPNPEVSAIEQASTPYFDNLMRTYSNATLLTDGLHVGLPEGQMGNSEVGHMNIGAGRVLYQDLVKINKSIEDSSFFKLPILLNAINKAKTKNQSIHIVGLVSDGGVHSHINHLKALIELFDSQSVNNVFIHAITDGRDTDPKSAIDNIKSILDLIKGTKIELSHIIGRYFAMDRDKRWERIKKAYDLFCKGEGAISSDPLESIRLSYENKISDEFIEPINCSLKNNSNIEDGDLVIFFNYRADRPRELTEVLSQNDMIDFGMTKKEIDYITFTEYDKNFKNIDVLFRKDKPNNTLGEFIAKNNKTQLRIAETEKYAHVTYFFSGGREEKFEGEERILAPSPKVATYDLKPEMSAFEIKNKAINYINSDEPDFICLNFANADMVGHTGDFEAAKMAAQTVDECLRELVPLLNKKGYESIIIADHGNSDNMINEDGSPNTKHSLNPVPIIYVTTTNQSKKVYDGILADVAPTIINLMGLTPPEEMTGKILIK